MGNTEAIPETKFTSSFKSSDKVFSTDERKVACDSDTNFENSSSIDDIDNRVETIGDLYETTVTDNSTITDEGNTRPSSPIYPTTENSSPSSDEEHSNMWQEVASRYQEILHREYRMLNLPSYPVTGGNVYLYYVPVIINPQLVPQSYGMYNECDNKSKAADKTSVKGEDVVYISDNDDNDCNTTVKEEPLEYDETVEKDSSFGNHIKVEGNKERFRPEMISCKRKNEQCDKSSFCMEETLATIKVEKSSNDRDSCYEQSEDINTIESENQENPQKSYDSEIVKLLIQDKHCSDSNIEVREDHIRIIKGYTIEYHPLHPGNKVNQWSNLSELKSQQDRKRAEKIQDLKKRLVQQKEELEKLKLQQSVEDDISRKGNANGIFPETFSENGNASEFTGQKAWKFFREFPSTEIHYFPSGERRSSLPRRNSRKQTLPRRIDVLPNIINEKETHNVIKNGQMETNINSEEVNCSVAKRKLTPSPELEKEKRNKEKIDKRCVHSKNNSPKRQQPFLKVKVGRKRRKTRHISQVSEQNLKKESQTLYNKTQEELTDIGKMYKATTPQDITQDEFLSMFGLVRMHHGQQCGTETIVLKSSS